VLKKERGEERREKKKAKTYEGPPFSASGHFTDLLEIGGRTERERLKICGDRPFQHIGHFTDLLEIGGRTERERLKICDTMQ
jgi:hypothetical protein